MAIRSASLYWCNWHTSFGATERFEKNYAGGNMRKLILAAASIAALDSGRTRRGAIADRDQVQPRGRDQHAEGVGGREVQGTGREIHRRQGQGRSLSELAALQGQGRAGSAPARRGADAGAVELEIRPDRGQGIRGVRSALHPSRPEDVAQSHRRPARRQAAEAAGFEGHDRPCLLGQRLQADERQQEAGDARPTTRA